jgi:hypothetical protein
MYLPTSSTSKSSRIVLYLPKSPELSPSHESRHERETERYIQERCKIRDTKYEVESTAGLQDPPKTLIVMINQQRQQNKSSLSKKRSAVAVSIMNNEMTNNFLTH